MYLTHITATIHLCFEFSVIFCSIVDKQGSSPQLLRLGNHEFDYGAERTKDTRWLRAMIPLVFIPDGEERSKI